MNSLSSSENSRERIILQEINETIPKDIQERYNFLRNKKDKELLQESEYEELITPVAYFESYDVKRLKLFIKLAALRNESFDRILNEFNIVKSAEYDTI